MTVETDVARPLFRLYEADFSPVNPAELVEIPLNHRVYLGLFMAQLLVLMWTALKRLQF